MPFLPSDMGPQIGRPAQEHLPLGWGTEPGDKPHNFHLTVDVRQLSAAARMPVSLAAVVVSVQLPASLAGAYEFPEKQVQYLSRGINLQPVLEMVRGIALSKSLHAIITCHETLKATAVSMRG